MRIISVQAAAAKLVARAQAASADYAERAIAAAGEWFAATQAAKPNYDQGIQTAIGEGRFLTGVQRAGAPRYARGVADKGSVRFGPGVAAAEQDYINGVQPFFAGLAGLTLPARRPRRDPGNIARVAAVDALMVSIAKARK